MTINVTGNQMNLCIVTDGEKCSVIKTDESGIYFETGKISVKGEVSPMIKTKIIETTEKYDKDGKLVEKITREETSEDTTDYNTECKCELKAEDIIKTMNDYCKRTGKGMFSF